MIPLIPLAVGAGVLALLASSSAKPKTTTPAAKAKPVATDFQGRIADALSRGDAAALLVIANDMQAAGLIAEAEALRVSALNLQALGALLPPAVPGKPPSSPGQPAIVPSAAVPNPPAQFPPVLPGTNVVLPPVVMPSTVPLPAGESISAEQQKRLAVAQAAAMNLRNTSRYQESKTLIKTFQAQEGLVIDGLYGPKSALAMARYGVVPPRPRYWSSKTMKADKVSYSAAMLGYAATDPTRAADWTAASKVQSDPVK
jgi:hypothetical protein